MNQTRPISMAIMELLLAIIGVSLLIYSALLCLEYLGWNRNWGTYQTIILIYNTRTIIVTIFLILEIGILNLLTSFGFGMREKWAAITSIIAIIQSAIIVYLNPDWIGFYIPGSTTEYFYNPSMLSFHPIILGIVIAINASMLLVSRRTGWLNL